MHHGPSHQFPPYQVSVLHWDFAVLFMCFCVFIVIITNP